MTFFRSRLAAAWLIAAGAACSAPAAMAQDLELTITAPAGAGGGWDAAARSLQEVMMATGNARSVQVVNVPGAGGTVGLAQFVQSAEGSPNQLLVGGITMVGAIITNKAPYDLTAVTRAFSGRRARGLLNRFTLDHSSSAPAAYPHVHHLTSPIRAAARQAGDPDAMSLWAGQGHRLAQAVPAGQLVRHLTRDAHAELASLSARITTQPSDGPPG